VGIVGAEREHCDPRLELVDRGRKSGVRVVDVGSTEPGIEAALDWDDIDDAVLAGCTLERFAGDGGE
jgi:hypothetical protein